MDIKITGCHDCPLYFQNPEEGGVCSHPDGENINAGGNGSFIETPDNCPLIKEEIVIHY